MAPSGGSKSQLSISPVMWIVLDARLDQKFLFLWLMLTTFTEPVSVLVDLLARDLQKMTQTA